MSKKSNQRPRKKSKTVRYRGSKFQQAMEAEQYVDMLKTRIEKLEKTLEDLKEQYKLAVQDMSYKKNLWSGMTSLQTLTKSSTIQKS